MLQIKHLHVFVLFSVYRYTKVTPSPIGGKFKPTHPFIRQSTVTCKSMNNIALRLLTECFLLVESAMFDATFNLVTRIRLA